jgi:hypothetical protein
MSAGAATLAGAADGKLRRGGIIAFQNLVDDAGQLGELFAQLLQGRLDAGRHVPARLLMEAVEAEGHSRESVAEESRRAIPRDGGRPIHFRVAFVDFFPKDGDLRRRVNPKADLAALNRQHLDRRPDAGDQESLVQSS